MRIAPNSGGKAIVQGQWSRSVANHTVTTDADENTVHIDLLKGVAKEAWPSLFRVRPSSTTMQQQELRRVITPAAGRDGVELTLVVGELVVLLNMVDNTWAKGSIFGGSDDVGLFRLDDTDPDRRRRRRGGQGRRVAAHRRESHGAVAREARRAAQVLREVLCRRRAHHRRRARRRIARAATGASRTKSTLARRTTTPLCATSAPGATVRNRRAAK
jgi:hypothetical protein